MLVRLADWCFRRRRLVVAAWVVALVGSVVLAGAFGGDSRQDYLQPGSESKAASDTLEERFPQESGDTVQIVVHSDAGVSAPRSAGEGGEDLRSDAADGDHVVGVVSPFTDEGAAQISEDREDRVRRRRPRQAGQRLHPCGGQGTGGADPGRRGRHPPGRGRRTRRGALRDRPVRFRRPRADRRGHHLAVHLRVCRGDGTAAGHRRVRPGHAPGARRAPGPGGRRTGLGTAHRGDGRSRCRHRLRTAHRHAVPERPRRRAGAAARHPECDRDRRPGGGLRRPHRHRLDARHPAGRAALPERLRRSPCRWPCWSPWSPR